MNFIDYCAFAETWWCYRTSWWGMVCLTTIFPVFSSCLLLPMYIHSPVRHGCVNMLSLSLSPVTFLTASSMFPKSTHETFAQKLYQTFQKHKRFVKPKLSRTDFTICHYAGEVGSIFLSSSCIELSYMMVSCILHSCLRWCFVDLWWYSGAVPIWSVPWQKQRLRCGGAPGTAERF